MEGGSPEMTAPSDESGPAERRRQPGTNRSMDDSAMIDLSMLDLFRLEVEANTAALNRGLLALEADPTRVDPVEEMMRAAHSLKGAARIVGVVPAVWLAHGMEDCFVAVGAGRFRLSGAAVDLLLEGVDRLGQLGTVPGEQLVRWLSDHEADFRSLADRIGRLEADALAAPATPTAAPAPKDAPSASVAPEPEPAAVDAGLQAMCRQEIEMHAAAAKDAVLTFEAAVGSEGGAPTPLVEPLVQALRSIKSVGRIGGLPAAAVLGGALDARWSAVGRGAEAATAALVDASLRGLAAVEEGMQRSAAGEAVDFAAVVQELLEELAVDRAPTPAPPIEAPIEPPAPTVVATEPTEQCVVVPDDSVANATGKAISARPAEKALERSAPKTPADATVSAERERVVRVSSDSMDRLMGLAGEALVEARQLAPLSDAFLKLKQLQGSLWDSLRRLAQLRREETAGRSATALGDAVDLHLADALQTTRLCRETLAGRIQDLESYVRRTDRLTGRLYREVIASRMRPFADVAGGFPRMVRDLARQLGKRVRFELVGENTPVDRDILDKLEAPIAHILRNGLDHGLETP
ncbi:MAG: Hpt domain-containing protein, partial [Planctomycetia bacterium]